MNASVQKIYRYPVKGLSPESMKTVSLKEGETIAGDRAFAIEHGALEFDVKAPKYFPKTKFLTLMRNEKLASLSTTFDQQNGALELRRRGKLLAKGNLDDKIGRTLIEQFLSAYMKDDIRGVPHIVHAPGHSFSDVPIKCLSIINLATVADLETAVGAPIDPLRFRGNLYIDGVDPWRERSWVNRDIKIGSTIFSVVQETSRCAATNVSPTTAMRDLRIPQTLLQTYAHQNLGVYAVVKSAGTIQTGHEISVLDT
jgi:hypothetical protein